MQQVDILQRGDKGGPWGYDDLMVLAAFRYCVRRRSYIVQDCVDWLIAYWPEFGDFIKDLLRKELEELFDKDDEFRSTNIGFPSFGDNYDRAAWNLVRALWSEK